MRYLGRQSSAELLSCLFTQSNDPLPSVSHRDTSSLSLLSYECNLLVRLLTFDFVCSGSTLFVQGLDFVCVPFPVLGISFFFQIDPAKTSHKGSCKVMEATGYSKDHEQYQYVPITMPLTPCSHNARTSDDT